MPLTPELLKFTTTSPKLVSYNFTDSISGVAYGIFYGGRAAGSNNFLISSVAESDNTGIVIQGGTSATATDTEVVNTDFTTTFSTSQIIEGDAIISFTQGLQSRDAEGANVKVKIHIEKNDVSLVSAETAVNPASSEDAPNSFPSALKLTVPKTNFEIGDTLTINVIVFGYCDAVGNFVWAGIGTDPTDRNDDYSTYKIIEDGHSTVLKAYIPFKVTD